MCAKYSNWYLLVQDLTDKFRYEYSKLWLSILKVDRDGMRDHCLNLGVTKDLYPLFACMLTGRPWNSVIGGIDRVKQSAKEVSHIWCSMSSIVRMKCVSPQTERRTAKYNIDSDTAHIRRFGTGRSSNAAGTEDKRFNSQHRKYARNTKSNDLFLGDVQMLCENRLQSGQVQDQVKVAICQNFGTGKVVTVQIECVLFAEGDTRFQFIFSNTASDVAVQIVFVVQIVNVFFC